MNSMPAIPPRLIEAINNRTFIPFVGAGLSKQADPVRFPSWTELLTRMIQSSAENGHITVDEAGSLRDLLSRHRHLMVAESLKSKLPTDFYYSVLESQFATDDVLPAKVHQLLFDLLPRLIITTNYDTLIEDAFAHVARKSLTVIDYADPAAVQRRLQDNRNRERPFLFKIHGNIIDAERLILTESDYRKLTYDESGYKTLMASLFINYTVLFLGFSFADEELASTLGQLRHYLKTASHPDYILLAEGAANSIERERFRKDYGLEVITYPSDPQHKGVVDFLSRLRDSSAIAARDNS